MARKRRKIDPDEEKRLLKFLDDVAPREPLLRIYEIDYFGKQTRLVQMAIDDFDEDWLCNKYGSGKYLPRTVRSDGTWGPSRIFRCA